MFRCSALFSPLLVDGRHGDLKSVQALCLGKLFLLAECLHLTIRNQQTQGTMHARMSEFIPHAHGVFYTRSHPCLFSIPHMRLFSFLNLSNMLKRKEHAVAIFRSHKRKGGKKLATRLAVVWVDFAAAAAGPNPNTRCRRRCCCCCCCTVAARTARQDGACTLSCVDSPGSQWRCRRRRRRRPTP